MNSALILHPALVLIAAGFLLPLTRGVLRNLLVLLAPVIAMVALWLLPEGRFWETSWLDYPLAPLVVDKLSRLFATAFTLTLFAGGLFALRQKSRLEMPAAFLYAGSAIGVVLAGDLVTVLIFWEVMAVGSTLVLWSANTNPARAASLRYAMIHLAGGITLFAGVCAQLLSTGDAGFVPMQPDSLAHWLILIGFLVNAGAPPLTAWLPDAYPEASWSGMVFLSAFTTKTAVYVLLRGFPGTELLIWVGLFMVLYGIVYALLENDIRRILAYSIVNQVGFMLVGIGIGTELSLNGSAAQAFVHVIYKALLLMSTGAILATTGRRKCPELGGLFHGMPLTIACGAIGALTFAAFPLTSGFIAKSMISQAAANEHLQIVWLLLAASSAGVVWLLLAAALAGVFRRAATQTPEIALSRTDSGTMPSDPPASMRLAMILLAFLCIALGLWPEPLYALLPYPVDYVPYTAAHVLTQFQLLLFSGLAFFVMFDYLKRTPTVLLDVDWLWRKAGPWAVRRCFAVWLQFRASLSAALAATYAAIGELIERHKQPEGILLRSWPTGSMALWVMIMLVAYLLFYYQGN